MDIEQALKLMKRLFANALFGLAALTLSARADDIKPGLWKISVVSSVAATPDWKPEPFELTQCLTRSDAENPAQILLGMGSPGATGCEFTNREYGASALKFDVSCSGTLGIKGHGEVAFTASTLDGALDVNLGETEKLEMQNKIHAVFLGDCPAERTDTQLLH